MSDERGERILIAGIGNIFLGDDGFGVEVAQALVHSEVSPAATIVDYGVRGLDLAYALLKPWRAVILVDAVSRGGAPGDLYLMRPADEAAQQCGLDPHSMDPNRVLALARSLGGISAPVYIIGCEPLDFGDEAEGRMGLSPQIKSAIPEAVSMVRRLLSEIASAPELTGSGSQNR
jgi:hydrogenase maturation protease